MSNNKLPYTVFVVPILQILQKAPFNMIDYDIVEPIYKNYPFTIEQIDENEQQIELAIKYLKLAGYIEEEIDENNELLKNTKEGSKLLTESKTTKQLLSKLTDKLMDDVFDLPKYKQSLYYHIITLEFLKTIGNIPQTETEMVRRIMSSEEFMQHEKETMNVKSGSSTYWRFHSAISHLCGGNLIEYTQYKKYKLTDEGYKVLENRENIEQNVAEVLRKHEHKIKPRKIPKKT